MTKPVADEDAAKICHGTPISLRLPKKYDELTRDMARREGRPLTNFVRWGFMQWLQSTYPGVETAKRARGGR